MAQAPAAKEKPESRIGAVLAGRYRITRVLGTGGMGSVFEAVHLTTEKKVAIKLLAGHLSKDLKLVARFRREAVAASRLEHENCVHVDDFGEDVDGTFYIAMELVAGRGLADELRAVGPMPPARVARIGVQLFKALDAAHSAGVLHRDLKPQNVMLTQKAGRPDIVKVVDFGIAKITTNDAADQQALTIPGTIFGTPEYMSPEQARGDTLDARSDIYSGAVVLWHMFLGRSPFRGTTVRDTLLKVFSDRAPSPMAERPGIAIPPGFEEVLQKAMAKNKEERWPDAASFAQALSRFADGVVLDLPTRARPGLPAEGQAPAPTMDKMPAFAAPAPPAMIHGRDTVPLPAQPGPPPAAPLPSVAVSQPPSLAPATEVATRFGTPSLPPPSTDMLRQGLAPIPPPSAPQIPMPAPPAAPSTPHIPEGAPKQAKVVTVDAVKKQTNPGPEPKFVPVVPQKRPEEKISIAGIIVVIGGLLILGAFTFVAVLVVQGKLLAPENGPNTPVVGEQPTKPQADGPAAPPADPSVLQKKLAGDVPLDPLARDAALGRAERAIADGRRADARAAFEDAVAADPTAPAALIGLGTLAMQQKDWATARDCFEKLISIDKAYRKQFGAMHARAKKLAEEQAK